MKTPLILSVDQGTNSSRAILFDFKGNEFFKVSVDVGLKRIDNFKVEQNPGELLDSVKYVIDKSLNNIPDGFEVKGIGLATQRSSFLVLDKKGSPLSQVISWQDRRSHGLINRFSSFKDYIHETTGLPLSPHYGATKIYWIMQNDPEIFKNNKAFLFAPLVSYLLFHLLDEKKFLVDHANASRTLLFDLKKGKWDKKLLEIFNIGEECLPECCPIVYPYGHIKGIPVNAVSGDQNSAVFSQGNLYKDTLLINSGTGAFILKSCGETIYSDHQLLSGITYSDMDSRQYTIEGTVNGAGAAVSYAREKLNLDENTDLNILLKDSEYSNNIYFLNTVGGLGSPLWKSAPEPRWTVENPDKIEALASVLESIVFLLFLNFQKINNKNEIKKIFLTGGISRIDYFCKLMATMFNLPLFRLNDSEATSRGIAFLAALKPVEWKKSTEEIFTANVYIRERMQKRYHIFIDQIEAI